jgi:hypothetical protein
VNVSSRGHPPDKTIVKQYFQRFMGETQRGSAPAPGRFFKSTVFKQPLASQNENPPGDDLYSPRVTPSMRMKNKINK